MILEVQGGPRGRAFVAWVAIVTCVAFTAWIQTIRWGSTAESGRGHGGLMMMELSARYVVGARLLAQSLGPTSSSDDQRLKDQVKSLSEGGPDQRLRGAIVAGEIAGPSAALADLDKLDEPERALSAEEERLRSILRRLYQDLSQGDSSAPSLDDADRAFLREHAGWFGRLALSQLASEATVRAEVKAQALQTTLVLAGALVVVGLAGVIGFGALSIYWATLSTGRLPPSLNVPSGRGGVYAESFAIWLVTFLILNLGFAFVPLPQTRLLFSGLAMILSMIVGLCWPVFRGIPWIQVRSDVGLTSRGTPVREVFLGIATYAMSLPILFAGVLVMLLLMRLRGDAGTGETEGPSHPIVEYVLRPNWALRLQVLGLGSILAPLVEETMFRGVLYYHLRDATSRLPRIISMMIGGTIVSFLFAAIHPQGLIAVPALMGLAYGFTLAREWRGSLISAMVAHGLNNGFFLLMLIAAMSG